MNDIKDAKKYRTMTLPFTDREMEQLDRIKRETGLSKAFFIRNAVIKAIKEEKPSRSSSE